MFLPVGWNAVISSVAKFPESCYQKVELPEQKKAARQQMVLKLISATEKREIVVVH